MNNGPVHAWIGNRAIQLAREQLRLEGRIPESSLDEAARACVEANPVEFAMAAIVDYLETEVKK